LGTVIRLDISHNRLLADFLHAHYCGPDWTLSSDVYNWINAYLRDPDVVVMGLIGADRRLYAAIMSTPVSGDMSQGTYMSHGGRLEGRAFRVIEGLCIHAEHRGRGLAGFMIYQIDAYTATMYERTPVVHLWSREESARPWLLSTALLTETYAYAACGGAATVTAAAPRQIPWADFTRLWTAADWYTDPTTHIRTAAPNNRRGALTAYAHEDKIIIVSNTGRITRPAQRGDPIRRIYEVVWCGLMRDRQLIPPLVGTDYQRSLDAVRGALGEGGILFARSAPTGGGATAGWSSTGWVFGRSGVHSWYIYNYVPPAFQTCLLHILREEL
jgi:hypothetical protein